MRFLPASEIILLGSPNSVNTILAALTRSSAVTLLAFFYNRKLAVVIYTAQKCFFFFNKKDHSAIHLPRLAWNFIWDCLLVWLYSLVFQAFGTPLYSVFNVCIHIYTDSLAKVSSFQFPYCCCATAPVFVLVIKLVLLFFCLSWHAINHCHIMPNWPIMFLVHLNA